MINIFWSNLPSRLKTRVIYIATQNIFGQTLLQRCCNVCVKRAHCNNWAIYERFENFAATLQGLARTLELLIGNIEKKHVFNIYI